MLDQILPAEDKDMARVVERAFKKQNITISTGTPVENVEAGKSSVKFTYGETSRRGRLPLHRRRPRARHRGARPRARPGSRSRTNGKVKIDEYQRTSNPKVYAIGDLVARTALAHKASEEGVVAVEHAAGVETHPVDQNLVAGATFCHPQVASVGLTEAAAKEAGHDVKVGKLKLGGVGAGAVYDDRDGHRQARRRLQVRRDPRRPHRRQPRLRHDRRAGRDDGARGRLPGAGADHPPAPDDLRGDSRRRPRRRRLGDPPVGAVQRRPRRLSWSG